MDGTNSQGQYTADDSAAGRPSLTDLTPWKEVIPDMKCRAISKELETRWECLHRFEGLCQYFEHLLLQFAGQYERIAEDSSLKLEGTGQGTLHALEPDRLIMYLDDLCSHPEPLSLDQAEVSSQLETISSRNIYAIFKGYATEFRCTAERMGKLFQHVLSSIDLLCPDARTRNDLNSLTQDLQKIHELESACQDFLASLTFSHGARTKQLLGVLLEQDNGSDIDLSLHVGDGDREALGKLCAEAFDHLIEGDHAQFRYKMLYASIGQREPFNVYHDRNMKELEAEMEGFRFILNDTDKISVPVSTSRESGGEKHQDDFVDIEELYL